MAEPQTELLRPSLAYINLLTASKEAFVPLQMQIQHQNGLLDLGMHLWYSRSWGEDQIVISDEYRGARDKLVQKTISDGSPLLFLEEDGLTPKFKEKTSGLLGNNLNQKTLFYVPTKKGSPFPTENTRELYYEQLKKLGVQAVRLHGSLLRYQAVTESNHPWQRVYVGGEEVSSAEGLKRLNIYFQELKNTNPDRHLYAANWVRVANESRQIPQDCIGGAAIEFLRQGIDVDMDPNDPTVLHEQYA